MQGIKPCFVSTGAFSSPQKKIERKKSLFTTNILPLKAFIVDNNWLIVAFVARQTSKLNKTSKNSSQTVEQLKKFKSKFDFVIYGLKPLFEDKDRILRVYNIQELTSPVLEALKQWNQE